MESINHDLDKILSEKLQWAKYELEISVRRGIHTKEDSIRVKLLEQMIRLNDLIRDIYI